ncbi:MAG: glycosyltransferase [Thaumarchaeota archaeon]|nr:glycosyltransferase [Nitrososphaerota archaeon]
MSPPESDPTKSIGLERFTVGICSAGESPQTLARLIRGVRTEKLPPGFELSRIVIAAGAPSGATSAFLRSVASEDERIKVISEDERKGKIDAVNSIIENKVGSYVAFVNADAMPLPGALSALMLKVASDRRVGAVSASPVFRPSGDLNSRVVELLWAIHNASALTLNHLGKSNHASDELVAVRSEALVSLPYDVVNDGAYIGGHASSKGYRILFSEEAKVEIEVPSRIFHLVEQRRRILFGHAQVWKKLGTLPVTLESLLLLNPALAVSILGKVMAAKPSRILVVPVAAIAEIMAGLLAMGDRLAPTERHVVWKRYRNDER